jgi:alpha-L-fucosidase
MAQLAAATRAAGLHFGIYFSIMNWNHTELAPAPGGATSSSDPRVVAYFNNFIKPQVAELINQYHPDVLWFDGEWVPWWTEEYGRELTEYIRQLDPAIIINNRVGKRTQADGDFDTPEQVIPSASSEAGRLWETADTLNDTWGYKANDNTWKSASMMVQELNKVNNLGGNFLLNVGPNGSGVIPSQAVAILQAIAADRAGKS